MSHRLPTKFPVAMLFAIASTLAADAMAIPLADGKKQAYLSCIAKHAAPDLLRKGASLKQYEKEQLRSSVLPCLSMIR